MKWCKRGGALAATVAILVSLPTTAMGSGPAPIALAGTTTITATTSSSVVVQVPKDLSYVLTPGQLGFVSLSGEGRAIAATLQPIGSDNIAEAIVVAQFNGCAAPGCARDPKQSAFTYQREPRGAQRTPDGRPILSAGAHRLTVLTDGQPVEVRLQLGGLTGATSGSTTTPIEGGITPATEVLAVPGSPVAWSGSADLNFGSANSLLLAYLQQDSPAGAVAGVAGVCHFTGNTRPLLGVPAPGCPFAPNGSAGEARAGSVSTETLTLGSSSRARLATALTPTMGGQQVGLWSTRVAVTTKPLAFFVWMRLS